MLRDSVVAHTYNFFDNSLHHLTFTHEKPGSVLVRDTADSPEREINLLQHKNVNLPEVIYTEKIRRIAK